MNKQPNFGRINDVVVCDCVNKYDSYLLLSCFPAEFKSMKSDHWQEDGQIDSKKYIIK